MTDSNNEYYDEFGFYSPMPLTRAVRRQPPADFPTGPDVGATIPTIVLPDQSGRLIDVHHELGTAGAVVVFHRSAYW